MQTTHLRGNQVPKRQIARVSGERSGQKRLQQRLRARLLSLAVQKQELGALSRHTLWIQTQGASHTGPRVRVTALECGEDGKTSVGLAEISVESQGPLKGRRRRGDITPQDLDPGENMPGADVFLQVLGSQLDGTPRRI